MFSTNFRYTLLPYCHQLTRFGVPLSKETGFDDVVTPKRVTSNKNVFQRNYLSPSRNTEYYNNNLCLM